MHSRILAVGAALSLAGPALATYTYNPVDEATMKSLLGVPAKRTVLDKDDAVRLRADDTLYWAGRSRTKVLYSNMTIRYPAEHENVINMEKFMPMLDGVDCSRTGQMNLRFKEHDDIDKAEQAWSWVNDDTQRKMVLLSTWPGCGRPGRRDPYSVSDIAFDRDTKSASLRAELESWPDIATSYHVTLGHADLPPSHLMSRQDDRFDLDITSDFRNATLLDLSVGDMKLDASCTACGSQGTFYADGEFDINLDVTTASITLTPEDVGLWMALYGSVDLSQAAVDERWGKDIRVAYLPFQPWNPVESLLELGPGAEVRVGAEFTKTDGDGIEFTAGARMDLSDDASGTVDFLSEEGLTGEGWEPIYQEVPFDLQGNASVKANLHLAFALTIRADINLGLGGQWGYMAGLSLKVPAFGGEFTFGTDADAATCPGAEGQDYFGVSEIIGGEIGVEVGEAQKLGDPMWTVPFFSTEYTLTSTCIGLGAQTTPLQKITEIPAPTQSFPGAAGNGSVPAARAAPEITPPPRRDAHRARPRAVAW